MWKNCTIVSFYLISALGISLTIQARHQGLAVLMRLM